jgi:hypothetical protein
MATFEVEAIATCRYCCWGCCFGWEDSKKMTTMVAGTTRKRKQVLWMAK